MNAQEQAQVSQMARMVDAVKAPVVQEGYVAQRHELLPDLLMVWAPCGCYWAGGLGGVPFVTPCCRDICDFQYVEIERALLALEQAEDRMAEAQIHVVPAGTVGSTQGLGLPETHATECEAPEASNQDSVAAQKGLDELIEAILSGRGPSEFPAEPPIPEGRPKRDVPVPEVPETPKQPV